MKDNLTPSKKIIRRINDLYIQTRKKYLVQFPDNYVTMDRKNNDNVWILNDGMIKRHLQGGITYGIFSGGFFNKFMTFDVDYNDDEPMARWVTLKIIDTLVREFNISRSDIHVSLSGGKGYHIDLFFDKPLQVADTEAFYRKVMSEIELPKNGEVEFRPSWTQGVKLPLGIHQRTGNRCWFVDNETLEPIESFGYIMSIEPMDSEEIMSVDFEITNEQAEEFERVVQETDISANTHTVSEALRKVGRILDEGRLTESNTRHATTYTIAVFGNMQGWEREETVGAIMDVL